MTIEEAIKDFEKEYPDWSWKIRKESYQGINKSRIDVHSIFSSGGGPRWFVICEKNNIPEGFLNIKREIEKFPSGNY